MQAARLALVGGVLAVLAVVTGTVGQHPAAHPTTTVNLAGSCDTVGSLSGPGNEGDHDMGWQKC
jgi:hypothetical protein